MGQPAGTCSLVRVAPRPRVAHATTKSRLPGSSSQASPRNHRARGTHAVRHDPPTQHLDRFLCRKAGTTTRSGIQRSRWHHSSRILCKRLDRRVSCPAEVRLSFACLLLLLLLLLLPPPPQDPILPSLELELGFIDGLPAERERLDPPRRTRGKRHAHATRLDHLGIQALRSVENTHEQLVEPSIQRIERVRGRYRRTKVGNERRGG